MPLGNQASVNALYADALDRTPDASGEATWGGLNNGTLSRAQVTVGVVESQEAMRHLAGRIENGFHLA